MSGRATRAGRLALIVAVAICALSAGSVVTASCFTDGEETYENCIEMLSAMDGEISPAEENLCSTLSAGTVNHCLKPTVDYVDCDKRYDIWYNPQTFQIYVLWTDPFRCT